jgi:hypothetical protein
MREPQLSRTAATRRPRSTACPSARSKAMASRRFARRPATRLAVRTTRIYCSQFFSLRTTRFERREPGGSVNRRADDKSVINFEPRWPAIAWRCSGNGLALRERMAIMWDPPADRLSLTPTPAEVAWRLWLVQALAENGGETLIVREALVPGGGTVGHCSASPRVADAG